MDPLRRMFILEKFIENQNTARLKNIKKASHKTIPSFLEIRDYSANKERPINQDSSTRQIIQEEL